MPDFWKRGLSQIMPNNGIRELLWTLHILPNLAILFIMVTIISVLAMLMPLTGRRVFRIRPNDKRDEAVLDAFKAIATMTGVVLAFALVEANSNLHSLQKSVAKEAVTLNIVDRALLRSDNQDLVASRSVLSAYGNFIVQDEWASLARGMRSSAAEDAYNKLSKQIRAASPSDARQQLMYAELLKSLDDLADLREQRIADGEDEIASFFWLTTGGLMLLLFILGLFVSNKIGQVLTLGTATAALSLLLSFVIIVDQPFSGEISVRPDAIVKALARNSIRQ